MSAANAPFRAGVVDRMIDLYCDWRSQCAGVQRAYERFLIASPDDRPAAFAAYLAALDREECASEAYAAQIRLVLSQCSADAGALRPGDAHRQ